MNPACPLTPPRPRVPRRAGIHRALAFTALVLVGIQPTPGGEPRADVSGNQPAESMPQEQEHLIRFGKVEVDPHRRTVSVPARLHMTNGILEYVLVTEYGKAHESLLLTECRAVELQSALLLLHARPTGAAGLSLAADHLPSSSLVHVSVTWTGPDGTPVERPVHELILLESGRHPDASEPAHAVPMPPGPWLFNGSGFSVEGFMAHFEGSLVSLITDPAAIINNPHPDREDDEIHIPAPARLPPLGTEVRLVLQPEAAGKPAEALP